MALSWRHLKALSARFNRDCPRDERRLLPPLLRDDRPVSDVLASSTGNVEFRGRTYLRSRGVLFCLTVQRQQSTWTTTRLAAVKTAHQLHTRVVCSRDALGPHDAANQIAKQVLPQTPSRGFSLEAQEKCNDNLCGAGSAANEAQAGLGMVVQVVNCMTRVKTVLPGGDADVSDTPHRSGDIIDEVDDKSVAGATLAPVQDLIVGAIGSAVTRSFRCAPRQLTPRTARSSTSSDPSEAAESRLRQSIKLQRSATAGHLDCIHQRARDMCATAEALRNNARGFEERVVELSGSMDRKKQHP